MSLFPLERPMTEEHSRPAKHRLLHAVLPAGAFLGGVLWDALTLGRGVKSTDLLILAAYLAGAAVILVLMGRELTFKGSSKLNLVLQFLFGGIFSAMVILYFLSSGVAKSFVVVVGLGAMMVSNEFLGERYRRLSLSWAVFGACTIMLLNFFLPHLMRSIHPAWFYVSLGVAIGLVVLLRRISRDEDAVVWPTLVVAAGLAVLHVLNLIPPVPLVSREMVIGSALAKEGDRYVVRGEEIRGGWPFRPLTLVVSNGEPIYCFNSVFVPKGIRTQITHQWYLFDRRSDDWRLTDSITFPVVGGRLGGYRGYTAKHNVSEGEWMVVAVSESGSAIASRTFLVSRDLNGRARPFERRF